MYFQTRDIYLNILSARAAAADHSFNKLNRWQLMPSPTHNTICRRINYWTTEHHHHPYVNPFFHPSHVHRNPPHHPFLYLTRRRYNWPDVTATVTTITRNSTSKRCINIYILYTVQIYTHIRTYSHTHKHVNL
jgi:hypothetical protein